MTQLDSFYLSGWRQAVAMFRDAAPRSTRFPDSELGSLVASAVDRPPLGRQPSNPGEAFAAGYVAGVHDCWAAWPDDKAKLRLLYRIADTLTALARAEGGAP